MHTSNDEILGVVADVFPDDLSIEELHRFTHAPIGACFRLISAVREFKARDEQAFLDGLLEERLKDRFYRRNEDLKPSEN